MPHNYEFVAAAYGLSYGLIAVYVLGMFFKLRSIRKQREKLKK